MVDCTFILFGVTGDLSKRKLLPGLCKLMRDQKLSNFSLIGVGLEQTTSDEIFDRVKQFLTDKESDYVESIKKRFVYLQHDLSSTKDFSALEQVIKEQEQKYALTGNRLVYCATPSTLFISITSKLCKQGIIVKKDIHEKPWHRIAYEKPFGHDLKSAKKINKMIRTLLAEEQVYRIDHYLAKEVVENILYIRFTNYIFESLWNNKHIESVTITLAEKDGIENRGFYYEHYGALADVVQNHILQLVALVSMNAPTKLVGDDIRTCKAAMLKAMRVHDVLYGQYEGYHQEYGVKHDSTVETFVQATLTIHDKRWKGVPFYIKTGKALETKVTTIEVHFKQNDCKLTKERCPIKNNILTIELYPKGGFSLSMNAKKPGIRDEVIPIEMDFCYDCLFVPSTPEAYEILLRDIMQGDQSVSVRFDEIELSWKVVESMRALNPSLVSYKKGSQGPL